MMMECGRYLPPIRSISSVSESSDAPNIASNVANVDSVGQYSELHSSDDNHTSISVRQRWQMNYREAAIFLEEGRNNDKFDSHPKSRDALPSYLLVHNRWFYILDFVASLMLLSLAAIEKPSIPLTSVPIWVHGSLELIGLFIVAIELVLKLRWQGWRTFVQHKRTMIKAGTLLIMFIEAAVVMVRQSNHFRVTRAIRPIFLIDNHYCGGVRRLIRQILQSLPPILDMFGLLLFFMLIFSILGFYMFSQDVTNPYFTTLGSSFLNLFVLLTTANFPDVMMPSYDKSKWTALFFVFYLSIVLYFLMNLMLAVVYDAFTVTEKDKLRKLLLHKRAACYHAFQLLVNKKYPQQISFRHFEGLLKYYAPEKSHRDVYLIFKVMNANRNGILSLEEFYNIYDCISIRWLVTLPDTHWFQNFRFPFKEICTWIYVTITSNWFDYVINTVILINGFWILADAFEQSCNPVSNTQSLSSKWYHIMFVTIYGVEAILKMSVLRLDKYFSCGWNVYDFCVLLLSVAGLISEQFGKPFYYVLILKVLRLLKVFQMKRRYRDVFDTLFILLPRMMSTLIVFFLLYYFFAVIGMELFAGYDMKNCCKNTTIANYYFYNESSSYQGYYYLNTFDNMFKASVTLFELTVVNNWFVIMEAYAFVSSPWTRIYFMTFYVVTMIVLTIVIAFILEAFLFHIQYQRSGNTNDEEDFSVSVTLSQDELQFCYNHIETTHDLLAYTRDLNLAEGVTYQGITPRTKLTLSLKMYHEEVKEWLKAGDASMMMMMSQECSSNNLEATHSSECSTRNISVQLNSYVV